LGKKRKGANIYTNGIEITMEREGFGLAVMKEVRRATMTKEEFIHKKLAREGE
jgi:hypothetical protein